MDWPLLVRCSRWSLVASHGLTQVDVCVRMHIEPQHGLEIDIRLMHTGTIRREGTDKRRAKSKARAIGVRERLISGMARGERSSGHQGLADKL